MHRLPSVEFFPQTTRSIDRYQRLNTQTNSIAGPLRVGNKRSQLVQLVENIEGLILDADWISLLCAILRAQEETTDLGGWFLDSAGTFAQWQYRDS
jgi:hypothetical protein